MMRIAALFLGVVLLSGCGDDWATEAEFQLGAAHDLPDLADRSRLIVRGEFVSERYEEVTLHNTVGESYLQTDRVTTFHVSDVLVGWIDVGTELEIRQIAAHHLPLRDGQEYVLFLRHHREAPGAFEPAGAVAVAEVNEETLKFVIAKDGLERTHGRPALLTTSHTLDEVVAVTAR